MSRFKMFLVFSKDEKISVNLIDRYIVFLKSKKINNNTINSHVFMLRHFDAYLRHNGVIIPNLVPKSLKKKSPVIHVLSVSEIRLLIHTTVKYGQFRGMDCSRLNPLYQCITRFLASTGARLNEVLDLKIENVDITNKTAIFEDTKNNENRTVYLSKTLASEISHQIESRRKGYVFLNMMGQRLPEQNYRDGIRERAKLAGIDKRVHPHIFRHSFITTLYNLGYELNQIQSITGHKDIKSLIKYIHLSNDQDRLAAMSHPLNKEDLSVGEIIEIDLKQSKKFYAMDDERFEKKITKTNDGYVIEVKTKK